MEKHDGIQHRIARAIDRASNEGAHKTAAALAEVGNAIARIKAAADSASMSRQMSTESNLASALQATD